MMNQKIQSILLDKTKISTQSKNKHNLIYHNSNSREEKNSTECLKSSRARTNGRRSTKVRILILLTIFHRKNNERLQKNK